MLETGLQAGERSCKMFVKRQDGFRDRWVCRRVWGGKQALSGQLPVYQEHLVLLQGAWKPSSGRGSWFKYASLHFHTKCLSLLVQIPVQREKKAIQSIYHQNIHSQNMKITKADLNLVNEFVHDQASSSFFLHPSLLTGGETPSSSPSAS